MRLVSDILIRLTFDPKPQAKAFLNTINTIACGCGSNDSSMTPLKGLMSLAT